MFLIGIDLSLTSLILYDLQLISICVAAQFIIEYVEKIAVMNNCWSKAPLVQFTLKLKSRDAYVYQFWTPRPYSFAFNNLTFIGNQSRFTIDIGNY